METTQQPDVEDDDEDWEGWAEPEEAPTTDLFSNRVFESAAECLAHARKEHSLNLALIASRCVPCMRLPNHPQYDDM